MVIRALLTLLLASLAVWISTSFAETRTWQVESKLFPTATSRAGTTATIQEQMKRYGVPGVSIAVIDNGRIAWAKSYGVADSRSSTPVTPDTLFQAASISKPISALAALVLVDRGELKLDADVNRYLKSWKVPENEFTRSHPVTLRMLLSHTSGAGEFKNREAPAEEDAATLLQILNGEPPARNLPVSILETPGSAYSYSKAGYDILQQLLIDVSGTSFDEAVRSTVFQPLGMKRSGFESSRQDSGAQYAVGHRAGGTVLTEHGAIEEKAAAGLWTTPTELARYLIAVQQARRGTEGSLISRDLAQELLTPQRGFHSLGLVISGTGAAARFGHDGFNRGFEASMIGYIDGDQGAIVMANSNLAFVLIIEILDSIARAYDWSQYGATNMWPPEAPLDQQVVEVVPADLANSLLGKFETQDGQAMTVFRSGKDLFVDLPVEGEAEVMYAGDGRLFCPPLLFSDLGSPWMQVETDGQRDVRSIRAGYQGYADFRRAD